MPAESSDRSLYVATLLLATLAGIQLGATASLGLVGKLHAAAAVLGALMAVALVLWISACSLNRRRDIGLVLLNSGAVIAASLLLAHAFYDFSQDGQQYHQQAVIALIEGWNPLGAVEYAGPHALWINSYTKGIWLFSASLAALGVSLELGKSFNLLVAAAAWLLCARLFRHSFRLGRVASWALATAFACSPILGTQWPTFYNDNAIGSLLLVMGTAALLMWRTDGVERRVSLAAWATAIFLVANVKSTGMAYAGLATMAFIVVAWAFGHRSVALQAGAAAALAALLVVLTVGHNPYVTNTLRHGHPLYPLRGGSADIITGTASADFLARGRLEQLATSVFSRSQSTVASDQQRVDDQFRLKVPGAVSRSELEIFMSRTDTRIGGFGPWFSLGLVLSGVCLVLTLTLGHLTRRESLGILALPCVLLAMTLVFPEPWWARYVPQFWFFPLSIAAAAFIVWRGNRWIAGSAWVVVLVMLIDALLVTALFSARTVAKQLDFSTQVASLKEIARVSGPLPIVVWSTPSTVHRLRQLGVPTTVTASTDACSSSLGILYAHAAVCVPETQMPKYAEESPWVASVKKLIGRGPAPASP